MKKAMILAAGLGTRLKPWTLYHPKALVPVAGVPMLKRIIDRLKYAGFDLIVINIHHFADQILDFLNNNDFGVNILVSDETNLLMDTGGGILSAKDFLCRDDSPFLIHNVDIVSNADLNALYNRHVNSDADATLLVSDRHSSRKLVADRNMHLIGWHNSLTGQYRPDNFLPSDSFKEYAFSGIHIMNTSLISKMEALFGRKPFPIMDFYLSSLKQMTYSLFSDPRLSLIDIGKPDTLANANEFLSEL